ncbi:MAG: methyltransferase, TrmH family [Solirubrobacterales bacterium]|jgi:TrmH family RNA methyltransferase|nr:methyltransferase, TrmH family [Solirubrobacterales bacterium]
MITSKDNEKLKLIRKLAERKHREREGLFVAEGEDLVAAAEAAGREPEFVLRAGEDVEPALLDAVSTLGSGTRVIGVYRCAWGEPEGARVSLHGVGDPGNVGTIVRTAHGLLDSAVVLAPGCADPFGPKAVRASMGSIFAKPPCRGQTPFTLERPLIGLVAHGGAAPDTETVGCLCLGGEREGLPAEVAAACDRLWTIPLRPGVESVNVAAAAAIALGRISSAAAEGEA